MIHSFTARSTKKHQPMFVTASTMLPGVIARMGVCMNANSTSPTQIQQHSCMHRPLVLFPVHVIGTSSTYYARASKQQTTCTCMSTAPLVWPSTPPRLLQGSTQQKQHQGTKLHFQCSYGHTSTRLTRESRHIQSRPAVIQKALYLEEMNP
jgi:hypothetical protein